MEIWKGSGWRLSGSTWYDYFNGLHNKQRMEGRLDRANSQPTIKSVKYLFQIGKNCFFRY